VANERLRNSIAVLVAGVWAISAIDGILTQNWTGLGIVTPMMMLIGGFLFGFKHEAKKVDEKSDEIKPPSSRDISDDLADW
jgi:ATP/ADP translocase